LVEDARRRAPVLDAFIGGQSEEVFVKNLENVQGDERDHIVVSIGYGPRVPNGRLDSMNFGPVSTDGGPRRLNVLFTRARYRCEIFCSFDPRDIDTERARSDGVRVLKQFLDYAETGILDQRRPTGKDPDSPFEEDVARVVRLLGFTADAQVGTVGFKIDLGVRDPALPGRYILAVECDGATYHGALWARERDRLRQEVLEAQGWRFHRIWSTDWFYRRPREIERLRLALEDARARNGRADPQIRSAVTKVTETPVALASPPSFRPKPYALARLSITRGGDPHTLSPGEMAAYVKKIVEIEGPIHEEEIARRVADLFGKERAGSRIQVATRAALKHLRSRGEDCKCEDGFWFTPGQQKAPELRDRSDAPISLQRAAMLPPIEIRAAILKVKEQNGSVSQDDLAIGVARLFGFSRTGSELRARILEVGRLMENNK
jgi:very-short-patch-repair endonuclease